MRKYLIWLIVFPCALHAQTQEGTIRTASRPNQAGKELSGVMLRVRGSHNAVASTDKGTFSLILPSTSNGQAFTLSMVQKVGYELCDPNLIGRQLAYSNQVPLEIVMLDQQQLLLDKQAIEQQARSKMETYYDTQLAALNDALAQAQLTNQEYENRINQLEEQYERFEPLLAALSDRYARTDYATLDSTTIAINQAIEQGQFDQAEQLILQKGSVDRRQKAIQEAQKLIEASRKELFDDLYHLYSIALARMQNDTAESYILRRAELDTLSVSGALDAGMFLLHYRSDRNKALFYLHRAYKNAVRQGGAETAQAADCLNEIATTESTMGRVNEALTHFEESMRIRQTIYGAKHALIVESMNNIGVVYYQLGDTKQALRTLNQAISLSREILPANDKRIGNQLTNLGAIAFFAGDIKKALGYFQESEKALLEAEGDESLDLASTYYLYAQALQQAKQTDKAQSIAQKCYTIRLHLLGEHHPNTQKAKVLL